MSTTAADHQLIVGGQRSGKSRHAERLAQRWLKASPAHEVCVLATAQAWDEEMRQRIARHQADRPAGIATVEVPLSLTRALRAQSAPGRLLLVDCLTLWLTNWLMPMDGRPDRAAWEAERSALLAALPELSSPVLFVSNEVGWGISPLGREVRDFVDELGRLNQAGFNRIALVTTQETG